MRAELTDKKRRREREAKEGERWGIKTEDGDNQFHLILGRQNYGF